MTEDRPYYPPYFAGYVTADEIDRFVEWHAKAFGCGKHARKRKTEAVMVEPRDRGEGAFGVDSEPEERGETEGDGGRVEGRSEQE